MSSKVYFARCFTARGADMGSIKIGCSSYLPDRLDAVGANQPYDCRLITTCDGDLFEEAIAHFWLRPHRIAGEYFHDAPEVMTFVREVERLGRFPLPITITRQLLPTAEEARNFMDCHGLILEDLTAAAGTKTNSYQTAFKRGDAPNRRMIAAMMVAALRKGHAVDWAADLRPPRLPVAA